jgi:hypothetical protein
MGGPPFCFCDQERKESGNARLLRAEIRHRERGKCQSAVTQSLGYRGCNLGGARSVTVDADGLRGDCHLASVTGDYGALLSDTQGLAAGFCGVVD